MKTSSAAYDLSTFAPEERRQPRVRVVKTSKNKKRSQNAFKAKCVAYVVLLVVLMSGTVYSRQQLTEIKSDINKSTAELTEIQSENAYLNYELESTVSLRNVETYAEDELGLVKVDSSQVEYISIQDENKIEAGDKNENIFQSFFNMIIEFFGW